MVDCGFVHKKKGNRWAHPICINDMESAAPQSSNISTGHQTLDPLSLFKVPYSDISIYYFIFQNLCVTILSSNKCWYYNCIVLSYIAYL